MVISCTVQEVFGPLDTKYGSDAFSLDEAKEFFEKDYATVSTKADAETKKPFRRLSPGEFTPLWENAQYSIRGDIAAFDVPVIAEKRIRAIRSRFGTDGAKAKIVNAYQKLVVVKNCSNGNYGAYILTLVPDIGHDTGGSILQKFISRTENRGNFSGIAIYTQPGSNAIIRIDEYRNGKKYRGVFLPKGTDTLEKRLRKAAILMKGICFGSSASPLTRAGEDWEWWDEDDDEWWDNFWDEWYAENGQIYDNIDNGNDDSWTFSGYKDIGDGYFMDNDGDIYFDSDGDGNPDSFVINDSTCESGDDSSTEKKEEEKPEDPEPPEKPEGDSDWWEMWDDGYYYNPGGSNSSSSSQKANVNLFKAQHFVSYSTTGNCLTVCKNIMSKMGQTSFGSSAKVIYLARENDAHKKLVHYGDPTKNYQNAIKCIDRHLDNDKSIIVGVNHSFKKDINDGTIDHFVLITGRGYDTEQKAYYYIYVETGSNKPETSHNPEGNRFYYDEGKQMFVDTSALNNRSYTITEIRPNDGSSEDQTITQPAKRIIRFFKYA